MKDKVLGFDIGTQSLKAAIIDKEGNIVDIIQKKYEIPFFIKAEGFAEQHSEFYYEKMCEASKELYEKRGFDDVFCFFISTIRDSTLCLDKNNKPLKDIILWCDTRRAEYKKEYVTKKAFYGFKLMGMTNVLEKQYSDCASNWIMQNEPDIWKQTNKYVFLSTYLTYKATGNLVDSISAMIGHIPFNYEKFDFYEKKALKRALCDIPTEKLQSFVGSGEVIGKANQEFSQLSKIPLGLEMISTGCDKGLETLGLGVIDNKSAAISFGTTATIQLHSDKYIEPQKYMPAYPSAINGCWNLEMQVQRGFWLVSWFKKEFASHEGLVAKANHLYTEDILNLSLDMTPPGNDGLILQPYWAPGVMTPSAKGCIVGFNEKHTKYSLYRAIIEGLGYSLYDGLKIMEKQSNRKIEHLYVSGGGSKSERICQITSDIFDLPVSRIQTHEATLLGGAMVCFKKLGNYSDFKEIKENMVHVKETYTPNHKDHEVYHMYYSTIYSRLYKQLEPIYNNCYKGEKENEREEI